MVHTTVGVWSVFGVVFQVLLHPPIFKDVHSGMPGIITKHMPTLIPSKSCLH